MRVLINGVAALRPKTGIGHYIESLCDHFDPAPGDHVELFPGELARRCVRRLFRPKAVVSTPASGGASRSPTSPWLKTKSIKWAQKAGSIVFRKAFRALAHRVNADLYHEPNYIPWRCDLPAIATVHDLSVLMYPEWHPAERVKYFETHFYRTLDRCVHLITDTECVRREIIDKLGIPPARISTVHLGIRPECRPLADEEVLPVLSRVNLQPGYLLHVGTIEPRKNLLRLMQAYVELPSALREKHPLILIGGWGWRNEKIRDYYESTGKHAGVRKLGYVPDEDLPALYNGARALLFPSHYEGFGLPPLEMLACGGAVISSTAGSVAEILPAGSRLLDPEDTVGWRDRMHEVLTSDDEWQSLRQGSIAHAARFNWNACARNTWAVYERVVGAGRRRQAA